MRVPSENTKRVLPKTPVGLNRNDNVTGCYNGGFMLDLLLAVLAAGRVFFRGRTDTALEVLALRQQVAVLKRKHPRPALNRIDRLLWIWLRRVWPRWKDALVILKPETVIGWRRAGFRLYWRWRFPPSLRATQSGGGDQDRNPPYGT